MKAEFTAVIRRLIQNAVVTIEIEKLFKEVHHLRPRTDNPQTFHIYPAQVAIKLQWC